jgi:hypothetical protein
MLIITKLLYAIVRRDVIIIVARTSCEVNMSERKQEATPIRHKSQPATWSSVDDLAAAGYRGVIRGHVSHGPIVRPEKGEPPATQLRIAVAYFRSSMYRVIEHAVFQGRNDHIADAYPEISSAFNALTASSESSIDRKISDFINATLVRTDSQEQLYISPAAIAIMKRSHNSETRKSLERQSISPKSDQIKKGRGRSLE